jgi:hypothetical protein
MVVYQSRTRPRWQATAGATTRPRPSATTASWTGTSTTTTAWNSRSIGDLPKTETQYRSYDYTTGAVGSTVNPRPPGIRSVQPNGGELQSLRYVGNITDNLTINALYGKMQARHIYEPPATIRPCAGNGSAGKPYPGLNYTSGQSVTGTLPLNGSSRRRDSRSAWTWNTSWATIPCALVWTTTRSASTGRRRRLCGRCVADLPGNTRRRPT